MYCLIVEDERQVREGLERLVPWESIGIARVECAVSGLDALERIAQGMPDVILSDVRMPHLSGVELLKKLREDGLMVPFVFMSGFSDKEYLMAAIRYGAIDYIEKPISIPELTGALAKAVLRIDAAAAAPADPQLAARLVQSGADTAALMARLPPQARALAGAKRFYAALLRHSSESPDIDYGQLAFLLENGLKCPLLFDATARDDVLLVVGQLDDPPDFDGLLRALNRTGSDYACFLGSPVERAEALPEAMRQARLAAARAFFAPPGRVNRYAPRDPKADGLVADIESYLGSCVRRALYGVLEDYGRLFFHAYRRLEGMLPEDAFAALARFKAAAERCTADRQPAAQATSAVQAAQEAEAAWRAVGSSVDFSQAEERFCAWLDSGTRARQIQAGLSEPVVRVLRYAGAHISAKLSVSDLARAGYVSASHLSFLFRTELDTSVKQYVSDLRMEKARCLLRHGSVASGAVPALVGIEDKAYFNKLFQKMAGMTPCEYRRRYAI